MSGPRRLLSDLTYGWIRATGNAGGLRVLMYHRVTDAHPDERLCVRVRAFAEQMRLLRAEGYRTVSFEQAVAVAQGQWTAPERSIALTFDDGFEDNYQFAFPAMAEYDFTACFFLPSAFILSGASGHAAADRPMTWKQIHEIAAHGHEIGSHSVSHRKLTLLPLADAEWEVRTCKATIEQGVGKPVKFFCYPAGAYNPAIRNAVKAAGYAGACSVKPGPVRAGQDSFGLQRTEISGFDSLGDFRKKLAGAYDWMHAAVQFSQGLRKTRECANAMPMERSS